MAHQDPSPVAPEALYDVLLADRLPEDLLERFPNVAVGATGVQTILRRRLNEPSQLDALLEQLCSLGVPLAEVHRSPAARGEERTYEVRVEGEVGEPLLRHLAWPHHVVPGQTRVQIRSAQGELHQFLRACTEAGASIQRVLRLSRARADARVVRPRLGG